MRWRVRSLAAAGAVAALVGFGLAWAGTHPLVAPSSSLVVGRYGARDLLALTDVAVLAGSYRVSYSAEVQFFSSTPGARLYCAVIDTQGRVGYLERTLSVVPATGAWTHIEESDTADVPRLTFGLRCRPSIAGSVGFAYRSVELTAVPLTR